MSIGIYKRKPIIKKGEKHGKLTAIKFDHKNKYNHPCWLFKCDCGNEKVIATSDVKTGNTKSCGCIKKEQTIKQLTTHGMSYTPEYNSWRSMKERCLNKNNHAYKFYGGRGITVCDRWLGENGFKNFYEDMGKKPVGLSLDRIDNSEGYYKENCRWATQKEQTNNTRRNIFVSINGVQISFSELAEMFGLSYNTLYARMFAYNWDIKKALIN